MLVEPSWQVLRAALRDAPVGIGVCDEDGRVIAASTSLTRLLRRTRDEITGRPFLAFVHPEDRPSALACYVEAVVAAAVGVHDGRTTLRCPTGDQATPGVEDDWTVSEADESTPARGILYVSAPTAAAAVTSPASRTHQPAARSGQATAPAATAPAGTGHRPPNPHRPTLPR